MKKLFLPILIFSCTTPNIFKKENYEYKCDEQKSPQSLLKLSAKEIFKKIDKSEKSFKEFLSDKNIHPIVKKSLFDYVSDIFSIKERTKELLKITLGKDDCSETNINEAINELCRNISISVRRQEITEEALEILFNLKEYLILFGAKEFDIDRYLFPLLMENCQKEIKEETLIKALFLDCFGRYNIPLKVTKDSWKYYLKCRSMALVWLAKNSFRERKVEERRDKDRENGLLEVEYELLYPEESSTEFDLEGEIEGEEKELELQSSEFSQIFNQLIEKNNMIIIESLIYLLEQGEKESFEVLLNEAMNYNEQLNHQLLLYAFEKESKECIEYLLKNITDFNLADIYGYTVLMWASKHGHKNYLKLLIEAGTDVNSKIKENLGTIAILVTRDDSIYRQGWTALMFAAENGHKDCLELLIKAGADVNSKDKNEKTPLIFAAGNGHKDCLELLIKAGEDVNAKDKNEKTPLIYAAENGYTDCLDLLIKAGADVNAKDKNEKTPLIFTAGNGYKDCLELLIKAGEDVNSKDKNEKTPLIFAAGNGYKDCLELLIKAGADTDAKDRDGIKALMIAVINGHKDCLELLIKAGADADAKDRDGITALTWAAKRGNKEIVKLLIKAGADVNFRNSNEKTPLIYAAENGHKDCLELLIKAGADIHSTNSKGNTALMCAAKKWNKECVKLFLKHGDYDISNYKDNKFILSEMFIYAIEKRNKEIIGHLLQNGASIYTKIDKGIDFNLTYSMLYAAENGHKDCLELLIKAGADVNSIIKTKDTEYESSTKYKEGKTALMFAAENGHKDCLDLLLKSDADVNSIIKEQHKMYDDYSGSSTKYKEGKTTLMFAAENGHIGCLELLIKAGAEINSIIKIKKDEESSYYRRSSQSWQIGKTALIFAAQNGHKDCFELLIKAGADVNSQLIQDDGYSMSNGTALMFATENNHKDILKILIEKRYEEMDKARALMFAIVLIY